MLLPDHVKVSASVAHLFYFQYLTRSDIRSGRPVFCRKRACRACHWILWNPDEVGKYSNVEPVSGVPWASSSLGGDDSDRVCFSALHGDCQDRNPGLADEATRTREPELTLRDGRSTLESSSTRR